MAKVLEVIPSKWWRNQVTGATASIYGSVPWLSASEGRKWKVETRGYTLRMSNGTVGIGRKPFETIEQAKEHAVKINTAASGEFTPFSVFE